MSAEDAVAEGQAHQEAEQVAADAPVASKKMDVDQAAEYGDDYVVVSKDDVKDMPAEEKSEEKPKPAKSPAKKRPASGDEDDEDDDEPAAKKPMNEANPIVEGRRQRKEVKAFVPEVKVSEKKPLEIPQGKGKALGDIVHIEDQLKRIQKKDVDTLKKVHRLLFKRDGSNQTVRGNIRKFCGFVFASDAERAKKKEQLAKHTNDDLKFFCDFFNVSRGAKDEMVETVLAFLENPQPAKDDKAGAPKAKIGGGPKPKASKKSKKSGKSSGKASGKASKKSAKDSDKGPKKALSAYFFFANDKRPEVMKENPDMKITDAAKKLGEMWKEMTDEDKRPYEKKAEADKERYEREKASGVTRSTPKKKAKASAKAKTTPKKKATPKKSTPKKAASSGESDSDSEDDEPIAKKKGPSDAEIKKAIADIVKKVGDEVSFNKVKDGLLNKYPSLDVAARKAEFKDWAREIIESQ